MTDHGSLQPQEGASVPSVQEDKPAGLAEILAKVEERERALSACADLYEEIYDFMEAMISRTYLAYDAARGLPDGDALRLKHITALSIRDDYKRTTRENREDVALMAALRHAAPIARALGEQA